MNNTTLTEPTIASTKWVGPKSTFHTEADGTTVETILTPAQRKLLSLAHKEEVNKLRKTEHIKEIAARKIARTEAKIERDASDAETKRLNKSDRLAKKEAKIAERLQKKTQREQLREQKKKAREASMKEKSDRRVERLSKKAARVELKRVGKVGNKLGKLVQTLSTTELVDKETSFDLTDRITHATTLREIGQVFNSLVHTPTVSRWVE